MPSYYWDAAKDALLRRQRGISFDQVAYLIENGGLLAIVGHNNPERHPGQRIFIIRIGNYAYCVPFEETTSGVFLRTAYPSSRATRQHLR